MSKVIITAAICGAEVTRERQAALPITAGELAEEARRSVEAGAAIIHLHVRRADGAPTQDLDVFRRAFRAIRETCHPMPIIQPSTGGAVGMSAGERMQPLHLNPEMATLDCGTTNFGDEVFINDLPLMRRFAREMSVRDILPELEVFDLSHILSARLLWEEGLLSCHRHFDFVLGVPGALDATAASLVEMARRAGDGATWTVAGIGRRQSGLVLMGLAMGGHVRVGFEDNIYLEKGVPADSNARFVERVVRVAGEIGRSPASPDEARQILGIPPDRAERLVLGG